VFIAIFCLWAVYRIGTQLKDRATGLLAAFVLASCSQFIFIGKQAMVDMPLVGFMTAGLAFFIGAVFDREEDAKADSLRRAIACSGIALALFPQLIIIAREVKNPTDYLGLGVAGVIGAAFIFYVGFFGSRRDTWLAAFYVL